jgi:flavin reductase (DIM6/NTAB) family NADH-FMN oxidoreductase RutF
MEEKKTNQLSPSTASRLLHPKLTVLLTCMDSTGKANIITLAWTMPVSMNPPLLAVSIAPRRYSHRLIEETKEFVINIPTIELIEETLFCGRRTGRDFDKFKVTRLTPSPAKTVKPPIIKECIAHIECALYKQIAIGDHTLFIGEIKAAYVNDNVFAGEYDFSRNKLIFHVGGNKFATLEPKITEPRLKS